jgi:hypothetical protein
MGWVRIAGLLLVGWGGASWAGAVHAEAAALRARIARVAEAAERAGVSAVLDQAVRALVEADRCRVHADPGGAERAEAIAEAAVRATERRVAATLAVTARDAARARWVRQQEMAAEARAALVRARAERARLEAEVTSSREGPRQDTVSPAGTPSPASAVPAGAPVPEGES